VEDDLGPFRKGLEALQLQLLDDHRRRIVFDLPLILKPAAG
jgi:hypothetical protein